MAKRKKTTGGRARPRRTAARRRDSEVQAQFEALGDRARVFGQKLAKRADEVRKQVEAGMQEIAKEVRKEAKTFPAKFEKEMKVIRRDATTFGQDLKEGWKKLESQVNTGLERVSGHVERFVEHVKGSAKRP